jgi:uncharacterized membrane-anchored protein
MTPLHEHPLRRKVVSEMHLRRWPKLQAPLLAVQLLRLVNAEQRADEARVFAALPLDWKLGPADSPLHLEGAAGEKLRFVWEQHSEASAMTLFLEEPSHAVLLRPEADSALAQACDFVASLPGEVIRATRIAILPNEREAEKLLPEFGFSEPELVSCHVGRTSGLAARIWSDFRIGEGGFGRLLVAANGVPAAELSRLVQRLQELGNYRNMALLGLPMAQTGWLTLNRIEHELSQLAQDVARPDLPDDLLLERVTALSLDLISHSTAVGFRMGATAAYAQLVEERLAELDPRPHEGFQSLSEFTQRRLLPAVRTCAALVRREGEISHRAARFASLLRTRVETRIEGQNARMLSSMERSASMQIRLQQLVEGLSVVAISYYCVGLLSYLVKAVEAWNGAVPGPEVLGISVPVVVIAVALGIKWLKRRLLETA